MRRAWFFVKGTKYFAFRNVCIGMLTKPDRIASMRDLPLGVHRDA